MDRLLNWLLDLYALWKASTTPTEPTANPPATVWTRPYANVDVSVTRKGNQVLCVGRGIIVALDIGTLQLLQVKAGKVGKGLLTVDLKQ
jgi:hypothetical protein